MKQKTEKTMCSIHKNTNSCNILHYSAVKVLVAIWLVAMFIQSKNFLKRNREEKTYFTKTRVINLTALLYQPYLPNLGTPNKRKGNYPKPVNKRKEQKAKRWQWSNNTAYHPQKEFQN